MSRFSVSRAMERVEGGAREVVVIPRAMLSDIDAFDDDRGAGSGGRAPRRLWDVISHQRWFILGFAASEAGGRFAHLNAEAEFGYFADAIVRLLEKD